MLYSGELRKMAETLFVSEGRRSESLFERPELPLQLPLLLRFLAGFEERRASRRRLSRSDGIFRTRLNCARKFVWRSTSSLPARNYVRCPCAPSASDRHTSSCTSAPPARIHASSRCATRLRHPCTAPPEHETSGITGMDDRFHSRPESRHCSSS